MLKIQKEYVLRAANATSLDTLFPLLQHAIELEHATIPPYLTAMFSLKEGVNSGIKVVIHSVVIEEMLHMTISSNILNALGGSPCIDNPDFVPVYPGPLPMGIGDDLIVGIEPYSPKLVASVFMKIEEPEHPLVLEGAFADDEPEYHTIGEFYQAIQEKIAELAPYQLPGNSQKQVTSPFFANDLLFPILTKDDAIRAINIIVEQGEGTSTSPLDQDGEIAHYYRFEELVRGKKLVADPSAPNGFSFSGSAIPFDAADVHPLFPNTKTAMLPDGSEERQLMDTFNATYYSLLRGLHRTFNGHPANLNNTLGLMFDLRLYAEKLGNTPFPGKPGYTISPSFEFIPSIS